MVFSPSDAAYTAALRPAGPAPQIETSYSRRRGDNAPAGTPSGRPLLEGPANGTSSHEYTHRYVAGSAIDVERQVVLDMHKRGEIEDEAMHVVLRDMDLREARLAFGADARPH
jgi:hypothetical protein